VHLGWFISSVSEIVSAFDGCEFTKELTGCLADGIDGARGSFAQQMLELGGNLFDGVQVG
jgi:hypothetical protein